MNDWSDKIWEIDKEKTDDHWLELKDPNGFYRAVAKWDGCIHFNQYGNIPLTIDPERKDKACSDDYIHICYLDSHIERLLELKRLAQEHFNDNGYWNKNDPKI